MVIRDLELPLMTLWAKDEKVVLHPSHIAKAEAVIGRFPSFEELTLAHRVSRKYLLAYYYRMGEIDWKTYKKERRR